MSIVDAVARDVAAEEKRWQRDEKLPHAQPHADDELLHRFVTDCDEVAFTQMVTRHASLVMRVCRRTLGNEQDAEDAFQATFLVLVRKAASVRCGASLAAWLYKTAHRIALRARARRSRRSEQPLEAETMIATDTFSHIAGEHQQSALDEELNRLPEKYRLPLFLCCLGGKSRDEAAEQLGLSAGAIKGRLERGRQILRRKLMLRGVSLAVVLSVVLRSQQTAQAARATAPSLITSTARAGVQYAAGKSASGLVSQNALVLANGSFQIMSLTTTKLVACCLFLIGALAIVTDWLPAPAWAGGGVGETIVSRLNWPSLAIQALLLRSCLMTNVKANDSRPKVKANGVLPRPKPGGGVLPKQRRDHVGRPKVTVDRAVLPKERAAAKATILCGASNRKRGAKPRSIR